MKQTVLMTASAAALTLALGAGAQQSETEADAGETMIILDASGSMWGQIDGTAKIDIARATLSSSLEDVSVSDRLGLMAYGHRRKGDCSDIELLVKPGADRVGEIVSAASELTPTGKTPLSDAVRQAADVMKISENRATVVLVTDGLETCSADPCALGRELEAFGIDFTAHVIGFGLSRDEGRQIACLADETGGRYFSAEDAGGLGEALSRTVAATPMTEPEPVGEAEATLSTVDTVVAGTSFEVDWTGPDAMDDYVDVMPEGVDRTHGEASYSWTRDGSPATLIAPGTPGMYNVRYVWEPEDHRRRVLASVPIEVTEAEFSFEAPESARAGDYLMVDWSAPGTAEHYIDIHKPGTDSTNGEASYAYISNGNPARLAMPAEPGDYEMRFVMAAPEGRVIKFRQPILVTEAEASIFYPDAVEAGAAFEIEWDGPGADNDYIDIVPDGYEETRGELTYVYTANGSPAEIRAPDEPGSYDIRYILEGPRGERRILYRGDLTAN